MKATSDAVTAGNKKGPPTTASTTTTTTTTTTSTSTETSEDGQRCIVASCRDITTPDHKTKAKAPAPECKDGATSTLDLAECLELGEWEMVATCEAVYELAVHRLHDVASLRATLDALDVRGHRSHEGAAGESHKQQMDSLKELSVNKVLEGGKGNVIAVYTI